MVTQSFRKKIFSYRWMERLGTHFLEKAICCLMFVRNYGSNPFSALQGFESQWTLRTLCPPNALLRCVDLPDAYYLRQLHCDSFKVHQRTARKTIDSFEQPNAALTVWLDAEASIKRARRVRFGKMAPNLLIHIT